MAAKGRGAFICLEGIDHCGKTTHCQLLAEYLRGIGHAVSVVRFPDRETQTGRLIDAYLREHADVDDRAIHLLYSANRWERRAALERELAAGTTLVVDRYAFSGVAYTAAKGIDVAWCMAPDAGLTAPDVVVYLRVDPAAAAARAVGSGKSHERYETEPFQARVARVYAESLIGRGGVLWEVVGSSGSVTQTQQQIRTVAVRAIQQARSSPLSAVCW